MKENQSERTSNQTALLRVLKPYRQAQGEKKDHKVWGNPKIEQQASSVYVFFGSACPHLEHYFLLFQIKLSYNTRPSVTSNFSCSEMLELRKLQTPQQSSALPPWCFLWDHSWDTTTITQLMGVLIETGWTKRVSHMAVPPASHPHPLWSRHLNVPGRFPQGDRSNFNAYWDFWSPTTVPLLLHSVNKSYSKSQGQFKFKHVTSYSD